uniref:Uncharacterized protein n=1 Tax=Timema cristinae TaxID=61476 RepID=A0A7R9D2F0_TIMCR|nr:unnamed protein product [Timema cristinae]
MALLWSVVSLVGIVVGYVLSAESPFKQDENSVLLDKRPEWLLTCRREDPEISECVRRLFEHMFPVLAVGIPEIGVKRFEPLYIKKLALTKGHGAVVISGSFTDILAHGPSNATTKYALSLSYGRLRDKIYPEYKTKHSVVRRNNDGAFVPLIAPPWWPSLKPMGEDFKRTVPPNGGPKSFNCNNISSGFDLKNRIFELGIDIPEILVESEYDLSGKILILPLVGSGEARLRLSNVTTKVRCDLEFPKVNGREIMYLKTMQVEFLVRGLHVYLGNLFNGNKVLGNTLNSFLNKNSQEVLNELKDPLSESLAEEFRDLMNSAYTHLPTDLWLLD